MYAESVVHDVLISKLSQSTVSIFINIMSKAVSS